MFEIGMAPKLYTQDILAGGWKVIVMEQIVGNTLEHMHSKLGNDAKEAIKETLKNALRHMAEK